MTAKSEFVERRLAEMGEKYGPTAARVARQAKTDHNLPGTLEHALANAENPARRAQQIRNYLADYGNYPLTMTLCEVAGINGDSAEGCLFAGTQHCTCGDAGNEGADSLGGAA